MKSLILYLRDSHIGNSGSGTPSQGNSVSGTSGSGTPSKGTSASSSEIQEKHDTCLSRLQECILLNPEAHSSFICLMVHSDCMKNEKKLN